MFKSISIDGFRSFEGLKLDSLGRFNLIVGPGSAGKTNLLGAVFLACSNGDATLLHREQGLRRIQIANLQPKDVVNCFDHTFSVWNQSGSFAISCKWEDTHRSIRYTRVEQSESVPLRSSTRDGGSREEGEPLAGVLAEYREETRFDDRTHVGRLVVTPSMIRLKPPPIQNIGARFVDPFFQGLSEQLPSIWTEVEEAGDEDKIYELLKSLDSGFKEIRIAANEEGRATLRIHHDILGRVPLELFGAGFGKAVAIASHLVAARGGVLILDELDASLHIGAQAGLIDFLLRGAARHNVQIFATTHSLETVDAFLDSFQGSSDLFTHPEELQIIRLSKHDGRTQAKQASAAEARSLREDLGLDLRRTQ